jgi:predicted amino acid dehydrogenase
MSASDGDLFNIGADLLPEKELQSYRTRVDFAFIFHPRDVKDIARKFPFVTRLPEQRVMRIFERLGPVPVSLIDFTPKGGKPLRGIQIAVPSTAAMLLRDKDRARRKILATVRLAEKLGARIVCLGALTASLTDGGRYIVSQGVSCKVTTGHSLTVATVIATARKAAQIRKISFEQSTIAVVGACGSIGSACSRWLAQETVGRLILYDVNKKTLEVVIQDLLRQPRNNVEAGTNLGSISEADIVIVATNNPSLIIRPCHLKPGCVVIDDAQPANVSPSVLRSMNIFLAWGGLVEIPGLDAHFDFGLMGPHTAFSCLGEALILSAYGIKEDYTLGPVDILKAKHLMSLASNLGFSMPPLQAFGLRAELEEKIDFVSKISLRAQKRPLFN